MINKNKLICYNRNAYFNDENIDKPSFSIRSF